MYKANTTLFPMRLGMRTLSCFLSSLGFPDIMATSQLVTRRRLTLRGSVEPTFFGKPTVHNRKQ